jgi:uncharacterized protein (DUF952 family)
MTSSELHGALMKKGRIYTSPVTWENVVGVRVTPHIYTPIKDLEKVVKVIKEIAFDIPKIIETEKSR